MAFVPGCECDVFLSYTHRDNQTASGDGWVTAFHERLRIELSQELGADAQIYRDARIGGADAFTPALEHQLHHAATLIAVLSPSYQTSSWCQWELQGFVDWVKRGESLFVGSKSRAIKVIKKPLDDDAHRTGILPGTSGFDFWELDKASQFSYEIPVDSPSYKRLISQLAQQLKPILVGLARERTVYVGAAPPGMEGQRRKLAQELSDRKFRIVSAGEGLSKDVADDKIRELLRGCGLCVCFTDAKTPSSSSEGASSSLIDAELRIAAEMKVRRIVSAQDIAVAGQSPASLEHVPNADSRPEQVDLLMNKTTQELKETVLGQLKDAVSAETGADGPVLVYLICDRGDHPWLVANDARLMQEYLNAQGLEVKVPLGDDARPDEFSRDNRRKLQECDAVLLYWGNASQSWFDERVSELRQAKGWRHSRRFATRWAYLTRPPSPVKEHYSTLEADGIVRQFDEFAPAVLEPFVQLLRRPNKT